MARFRLPKSVQELADWYMRYVSPASLVAGVIADNLFLAKRVDLLLTNALLFSYLILAGLSIMLMNLIETGTLRRAYLVKALPLLPVVAQFAFGGLFSAYFSLYSRSAAISVSWIFVLLIVALIIGNERFAHFYARFSVQISIYFTVLFSFLIFFLPVVAHRIGDTMFLISGALALALITCFLTLLFRLMPVMREHRTRVARAIAIIYVVFNVLYFTNAIPPLPLSLKDAGAYHGITRIGDTYHLLAEPSHWYDALLLRHIVHVVPGGSVYVYSAIFAPSGLSTVIVHQWQRYDAAAGAWQTVSTLRFSIFGGRDGGYRGYSQKDNVTPGKWRVNVLTQYGQVVGRVSFTVEYASSTPALVERTR
jgi:hypothetical protein